MGRATAAAGIVMTGASIGAVPAAAAAAGASAPAPAGRVALYTENAQGKRVSGTFVGARLHVVALVSPFVAGQQVIVRIDRNGHLVLRRSLAAAPLGDGRGRVIVSYTTRLPAALLVRATHPATPQQGR